MVNRTEWSPIRSVITWVIHKIGWLHSRSRICLIISMDQIGLHKVMLPILIITNTIFEKTNAFLFFVKELLIPSIERNTSQIHLFWKIPSLVESVAVAMVIVINYVIGGLSWVHLQYCYVIISLCKHQISGIQLQRTVRFKPTQ